MDTADIPVPPITCPTTTISTRLYIACSALATNNGIAKIRICFVTLPLVRSRTIETCSLFFSPMSFLLSSYIHISAVSLTYSSPSIFRTPIRIFILFFFVFLYQRTRYFSFLICIIMTVLKNILNIKIYTGKCIGRCFYGKAKETY